MAKKGNAWNIPQNRCTAVYFVAWSCTMLSLIFTIAKYNCTKISVAELSQRVRNRKGQKWSFRWQLYCQHRFLWKFPFFSSWINKLLESGYKVNNFLRTYSNTTYFYLISHNKNTRKPKMVRWRLQTMFSILPIFCDFLATKPIGNPISLRKLIFIFSNETFWLIFKL